MPYEVTTNKSRLDIDLIHQFGGAAAAMLRHDEDVRDVREEHPERHMEISVRNPYG